MEYYKLISKPIREGFPEVEFTELDSNRWETRKVAVFSEDRYGYACLEQNNIFEIDEVGLSDKPWHSASDHEKWLQLNPQFEESKITKDEFEVAWQKAVDYWKEK